MLKLCSGCSLSSQSLSPSSRQHAFLRRSHRTWGEIVVKKSKLVREIKAKPFYLDAHLEQSEFILASGYSLADISTFGYTHVIDEAGLAIDRYPAIARWKASVEATDGFVALSEMVAEGQVES